MVTFQYELGQVTVPDWVVDLESFRRWADADDFPESGYVWFLDGGVWIDMSKEQIFTHVGVKTEMNAVLSGLAKASKRGRFLTDGVLLSNEVGNISGKPDGLFVSYETLNLKRVVIVEGMEEGHVELEGSPDMVMEIVSRGSEQKDCVILRRAYWESGIREYWLIDARKEPLSFEILRHTPKGYKAARKQDGWVKSAVFDKSFRLTQQPDALGHPEYTLEVR